MRLIGDERFPIQMTSLRRTVYPVPVWVYHLENAHERGRYIFSLLSLGAILPSEGGLVVDRKGWFEAAAERYGAPAHSIQGVYFLLEVRRISGWDSLMHAFPQDTQACYIVERAYTLVLEDPQAAFLLGEGARLFGREIGGMPLTELMGTVQEDMLEQERSWLKWAIMMRASGQKISV